MHKHGNTYKDPILTNYDDIEYRYRLMKPVLQKRSMMMEADPGASDEELKIPYDFILAILKYIAIHLDSKNSIENRGTHKEALFVTESKKKGIAVGVLAGMKDHLFVVSDVVEIPREDYYSKK